MADTEDVGADVGNNNTAEVQNSAELFYDKTLADLSEEDRNTFRTTRKLPDDVWAKMSEEEKKEFITGKKRANPKKSKSNEPKGVHPNHAHSMEAQIGAEFMRLWRLCQKAEQKQHGDTNGSSKADKRAQQADKRARRAAKRAKNFKLNEIRQSAYFPEEVALMELCVSPHENVVDKEVFDQWEAMKEAYKKLRAQRKHGNPCDDFIDERVKLVDTAMTAVGKTKDMPKHLMGNLHFQQFLELAFTRSFYNLFDCYQDKKGTDEAHRQTIANEDLDKYDDILTKIKNLRENVPDLADKFQWIDKRHIVENMEFIRRKTGPANTAKENHDVDKLLKDVFDDGDNNMSTFHMEMCKSHAPYTSKPSSKKADHEVTSLIAQIRAELGGGGGGIAAGK